MIASLTGCPRAFILNSIILDVKGVGYKVYLPSDLIPQSLTKFEITLFIHTHVRDDTFDLYGFESIESLQLFELIISVSGIGPKIALGLMSKGVRAITNAVISADVDFFTSIPRLGKKNAQKIIIELKPKLGSLEDLDLTGESQESMEIIEALTSLGFSKKEIKKALNKLNGSAMDIEDKIKQTIKFLGKNK